MRKFLLFGSLALAACGRTDAVTAPSTGPAATMQVVAGDNDTSSVDVPVWVIIQVLDASGQPVDGQLVNWVVTSGGGSTFVGVTSTNSGGTSNRWTLGIGDNTLEARAIDSHGYPVTFAVIHAFGTTAPRIVGWVVRMDGVIGPSPMDGVIEPLPVALVTPGIPYDIRDHLQFLLVDSATNTIIPGAAVSPSFLFYYPDPDDSRCPITEDVILTCTITTGLGFGTTLNVHAPESPGEGYRWRENLNQPNVPARAQNYAGIDVRDARLYANFTVTCNYRHSCTFDASSSKISNGLGTLGSYNWIFGDGYQGTRVSVVHDYAGPRTVNVTLHIYDSKLNSVRITKTVIVP
jgi:hypothetical protein